ncbi:hypothetical protein KRX51_09610 [Corynebacterium sp. TAE3-ERU12]|uniref:hypothetical protein n=1 Tax=Corynebacterium sp. TAE3-ERU12 TaxID=2849491 RepID=UPI001C43DD81|nr:hypothetical protein [Corynebacterium sp. TAE3-ERU12]MBV7296165.1 hypothetical protein [Corynebacterium sp. TAE3-ERU12]
MDLGIGEVVLFLVLIVAVLVVIALIIGIVRYAVHGSLTIDKGRTNDCVGKPTDGTQHDH